MPPPYSLVHLQVTDSTQDDARAVFSGAPALVVSPVQRKGRGRSASDWQTAPRAMAASLAFRPGWEPSLLPRIPLMAGVAAGRVLDCGLKWPNDVLVGERKVGGILVESADGIVVVGFGLNLWWPDPPSGAGAVHEDDPGPDEHLEVAERWAVELLTVVAAGPDAWPRDEYRNRCVTVGRDIAWSPEGMGRAVDVADDGSLVVVTHEGRLHLSAGEVRHVRMGQ